MYQMHGVGEGPGATPSVLRCFHSLIRGFAHRYITPFLKTSKEAFFLSPSDVYVRSFLYLFYTLIKLYFTKSSERSSLVSGPWINSSPPKAMNSGVTYSSYLQTFSIKTIPSRPWELLLFTHYYSEEK